MIIVDILGGLGNQMFQYACGRALSLRTEQQLRIVTDQFDGYTLHNGFELNRVFHIDAPNASEGELKRVLGWRATPAFRRLSRLVNIRWAMGRALCHEPYFKYWPGINKVKTPVYLQGYWQSERYFLDAVTRIREDFKFRMPWEDADLAVLKRMRAQPSVSLHLRRGDYTLTKNRRVYASCGVDYYRAAIRIVKQRVPNVRLFAFSDDPIWVEAVLKSECGPIETIKHNAGWRSANDMRLMSQADHHIIANSSFSWWGAWLNPSPAKIVVAPKKWFVNGTVDEDLIPSSWLRM